MWVALVRSLWGMKTRTLLLLAVTCGLVILLAGSVKLFLITEKSPPAHLAVGQSGTIGDMKVSVVSAKRELDLMLVAVTLVGADDPNGATTWVLGSGTDANLAPVAAPSVVGAQCGATKAAEPTSCVLAFVTSSKRGVLRYERAQEAVRWDIDLP